MALAAEIRSGAEDKLRKAMGTGHLVDWRSGEATADNPINGADWDAQRTITAALLVELLPLLYATDEQARGGVDLRSAEKAGRWPRPGGLAGGCYLRAK